jgi:hypothetical protein
LNRPSRIQVERTSPAADKAPARRRNERCACQHVNRASTAHPTSTRAWYGRHARRAVVRSGVARRSGATRRQGLGCPRWRARSLARVRAGVCTRSARKAESHPRGRAYMGWTRRAEGFDPSGVCVRICANVGGLATEGGDTKPTVRAQRRYRDKSTTSRFRRGSVQGRGGLKGSNLGSLARRTHVRRCIGVHGDGTAECRARHGQVK